MIKAEHITKIFGPTTAVDDLSFEVKQGENLVLLGTSGCGKTTTLRMLNRLIEPDKGSISINGLNILNQSAEELRRNIGYVLQNHALFPHYTVAENIAIVPNLLKWKSQETRQRTEELLYKLRLSPDMHANVYPHQLSGGQQQRVNVARALAANPPVLLMDEPFGALDPVTRSGIVKEFKELEELKGKTIVMVTHDVQEAFEMGDRICIMDKGKIMQIGTPTDLLFHSANDYVQQFLEKQQLSLSLKSLKLRDVWPYIPENEKMEFNLPEISMDSDLWQVMEVLTKYNGAENEDQDKNTLGIHPHKQRLSMNEILTAYSLYRHSGFQINQSPAF